MKTQDLVDAMDRIAPTALAESWDNVGLLVGTPTQELDGPVLLTIDLTEAVADEAAARGCRAVVAYHPPIFHPIKRVTGTTAAERVLARVIRAGIAVYSPHTALDATPGGITDWLADGLLSKKDGGGADRRALRQAAIADSNREVKIVTFVTEKHLEQVRGALATAGAGLIGKYELCSFAAEGMGTFRGKEGSRPAVGKAGRLESVQEHRLEMVCSRRALGLALETLRSFHPYEEPAVDVYELVGQPRRDAGAGRRLTLDHPATLDELADRLKKHLGTGTVQVAAPGKAGGKTRVSRIGVVPGAGASLAEAARQDECEVFVTGEMKHHEALACVGSGMSVILGGHTQTERGYLPRLARRLADELPRVRVVVSEKDREPFVLK